MFQKSIKIFLLIIVALFSVGPVFAETDIVNEEEKIVVYFFDDRLCSVCKDAKAFIEGIKENYPQLELIIYSISDTKKLSQIAEKHGVKDYDIMAPSIFINDNFFQFNQFTSREQEMIIRAIKGEVIDQEYFMVNIPFLNIEVDIGNWSLPVIAVILGLIDGFNVCSLGALILILSIVLVFESRKKIFFFGSLFILATVVIYGTLVFTWGQLFQALVGHLEILRIIIGLASLGGAVYFFKEFYRLFKYGPTCKSSESFLTKKATENIQKAFKKPNQGNLFLVGAVIFFATIITIVELPCSVGIPIAFTGILISNKVSLIAYASYVLIYLLFYMLDEFIVFIGVLLTKKIWFVGSKAITWTTFIGAIVLFYLAFYYLIGF